VGFCCHSIPSNQDVLPPLRRCLCGDFEMHPAAVNCYASTPVVAEAWFDGQMVALHGLFQVEAGVSTNTFRSVMDQLAASIEQMQVQPRDTVRLQPKVLGPAFRNAHEEQKGARCSATSGVDIFRSPWGECPACAGAQLGQGGAAGVAEEEQQSMAAGLPPTNPTVATSAALSGHQDRQQAATAGCNSGC
jgi:hypothetical protein